MCNPTLDPEKTGAATDALLPGGVGPDKAVTPELAEQIVDYQTRKFYGRSPTDAEKKEAREHGEACARSVCTAEEFARPSCFAILSSSEMLFY